MDEEKLDPLSRHFARALFAAQPGWRAFAHAVPDPDGGPDALEVRVPPPAGSDLRGPLVVSTEGGKVTVHFDDWHGHYGWPPGARSGLGSGDPLALIADILGERLLAASSWRGDPWRRERWVGSGLLRRDETASLSPGGAGPERRAAGAHAWVGGGFGGPGPPPRVRIRSWRGGHDRDEPPGLPDPARPELREDAAPPGVAAVFAGLCARARVPQVSLVWRHAAALPGGALGWLWTQARPALEHGAAAGARDRLAATVAGAVPAPPAPGAAAKADAGLAAEDEAAVVVLAEAQLRADLTDLALLTAIQLRRDGALGAAPGLAPGAAAPPGPPLPATPPPRLSELPAASGRAVRRLAETLGPGADDAVPNLYLQLARWPGLLAALPGWLGPVLEPVALAEARDAVIAAAAAEAAALVPALGPLPPPASKAALHDALFVFTRRVIPGTVPVGLALRRMFRGAAPAG